MTKKAVVVGFIALVIGMPALSSASSTYAESWKSLDVKTFTGETIQVTRMDKNVSHLRFGKAGCMVDVPRSELKIKNASPYIEQTSLVNDVDSIGAYKMLSMDLVFIDSPDGEIQSQGHVEWLVRDCLLSKRTVFKVVDGSEVIVEKR